MSQWMHECMYGWMHEWYKRNANEYLCLQALALLQRNLEGKREELHQEVVRSTKYKNVHLRIQDAISEVSDCLTPAGSSRCHVSHTQPGHL